MPKNTVPAAGEAVPAPSIYRLLAAYWIAQDAVSEALKATDAASPDQEEALYRKQFTEGHRMHRSLLDICGFVPRLRFEAKLKHAFLMLAASDGAIDDEATSALIASMADLVQWKPEAKGRHA